MESDSECSETMLTEDAQGSILNEQQDCIAELLCNLRKLHKHEDTGAPECMVDCALRNLCYKDFPALQKANIELTVNSKDKKLNLTLCAQILAMSVTLN